MYKTSISFIKAQLPNISIEQLLEFYKQELEEQQVSVVQIEGESLKFSNDAFKFVRSPYFVNRYKTKYDGFTSGQIKIEDTGQELWVTLEADNSRIVISAGIISGALTLFLLIASGFEVFALVLGLALFAILTLVSYSTTAISFPVYFTSLRNRVEQKLSSGKSTYR